MTLLAPISRCLRAVERQWFSLLITFTIGERGVADRSQGQQATVTGLQEPMSSKGLELVAIYIRIRCCSSIQVNTNGRFCGVAETIGPGRLRQGYGLFQQQDKCCVSFPPVTNVAGMHKRYVPLYSGKSSTRFYTVFVALTTPRNKERRGFPFPPSKDALMMARDIMEWLFFKAWAFPIFLFLIKG
ncbi:hypothetical protein GQ457_02G039910 [Hibiscus cannabinus]